jgi:superfamily II DNA or RNA helicase
MSLRVYQDKSLELIMHQFKLGKRKVLLWLATGAGKTVVFCEMIKRAVARGKRVIIVVRGRKLVDQASQRLWREKVEHGVLMAGHWNFRPHLPVQVCSIDTLIAREILPKADLIVIDEADTFGANTEAAAFIEKYPEAFIVPVTATPYLPGGLAHLADEIVHPITMQQLIDDGFLCGFRYFAPSEPDLRGVKVQKGEFNNGELEKRMVANQLSGDIVTHWSKLCAGMPTLGFAVNIHHSKLLVDKFTGAGIKAEHCDADTKEKEREAIIKRLECGKTQVVFNVGILGRGVDIPCVRAVVMARPTKSLNLFIQQAGRGTRLFPGKDSCLLLDHAGNIKRHGFPTMEPEVKLDGKIKADPSALEFKTCKECFAIYRGKECPECGTAPPPPEKKEILETEEQLQEIMVTSKNPIEQWMEFLQRARAESGRKQAWVYHKMLEKFTLDQCRPYLPAWFIKTKEPVAKGFSSSPFSGFGGPRE